MRKPGYETFAKFAAEELGYTNEEKLKEWYHRFDKIFLWRHPTTQGPLVWRVYLAVYVKAEEKHAKREARNIQRWTKGQTACPSAGIRSWNTCRACPHYRFDFKSGHASCILGATEPPESVERCERRCAR